jgi:SAM-dependent methyltransferase
MTIRQIARSLAMRVPLLGRFVLEREQLLRESAELKSRLADAERNPPAATAILDVYVSSPPSHEAAFRIYDGTWASYVPGYGLGGTPLFDDGRIRWFEQQCGGFKGKRVLELGPLEGGHTYMLSQAGAASITAIESNTIAFLKCLLVKNALKFDADFLLGDFRQYLDTCTVTYDLLLASGVLYHMTEPVKLLQDMAKVSRAIGIWTHYYDADVILKRDDLRRKFDSEPLVQHVGAREILAYKQRYLDALNSQGFCGGSAPISYWLSKDSILGVLSDLGFQVVVGQDAKDHQNGPAMTLFASR